MSAKKLLSLLANALPFVAGGQNSQLHQFFIALAAASGSATTITPLPHVLFVDNNAPLSATPNGSIAAPYPTIAAALASAGFVDGTTLVLAPGTYGEAIAIPAARRNIAILGLGNVLLALGAAGAIISYVPTGAVNPANPPFLRVQNVKMAGGAGVLGIAVDGSNLASTGVSLFVENVEDSTTDGSTVAHAQYAEIQSSVFHARLAIRQSSKALISSSSGDDSGVGLVLEFEAAQAGIIASHGGYIVQASTFARIQHDDQARVFCDKGVTSATYVASLSRDGNFTPAVVHHGVVSSAMTLGTLPDTLGAATSGLYDLQDAVIESLTVNSAELRPAGASINAKGSSITNFDGTGGSRRLILDVRGGLRPPTLTFDSFVFVNRTLETIRSLAIDPVGSAFTFGAGVMTTVPPFPTGTQLSFAFAQRAAIAAVADIPYVSNDDNTGFEVASTAGTTIDLHISPVSGGA